MKSTGIFYGSSMGNTQAVAEQIGRKLGLEASAIRDISSASADDLRQYELLFLGSSTWGVGDLQDDWEAFMPNFDSINLAGIDVAVFGTGDSSSYPDSFADAIGILAEAAEKAGARIVGRGVPISDYDFEDSRAKEGDTFCGLPLDVDNEDNKTESRIDSWLEKIKAEI